MNGSVTVNQSIQSAYNNVVNQIASFLPNLISALIILIVGWIIASFVSWAIRGIVNKSGIDTAATKLGIVDMFKKAGFNLSIAGVIAGAVWWFIMVITFIATADALKLSQVSTFIYQVAAYIPNIIAAALILMIGIIVADALSQVIGKAAAIAKYIPANLVSSFTKWAVLIFSFLAALDQLRIATTLIQILFAGIMLSISLALGLSFGLGGRDLAKNILEKSASTAANAANKPSVTNAVNTTRRGPGRRK